MILAGSVLQRICGCIPSLGVVVTPCNKAPSELCGLTMNSDVDAFIVRRATVAGIDQ